jgi:hypothetical protein
VGNLDNLGRWAGFPWFLLKVFISYLPKGVEKMERKDPQQDKERLAALKRRYERPEATFVPLKLDEPVMGCGLYSYCHPNSYYNN